MQQEMPTDIVNTFAVIQSSLVHTNTADKTQPVSRYKHSTLSDGETSRNQLASDVQLYGVNYDGLKEICAIRGLGSPDSELVPGLAHCEFMQRYKEMFITTRPRPPSQSALNSLSKWPAQSSHSRISSSTSDKRPRQGCYRSRRTTSAADTVCDDISEERMRRRMIDVDVVKDNMTQLRRLMQKKSVERSKRENEEIYVLIKTSCDELRQRCEPIVLKQLCTVAQLDVWHEANVTIDASSGFYVILSGSVTSSSVHLNSLRLTVGDVFGTLETGESPDAPTTRIRSVNTVEPCELFLITTSDYRRVKQKIQNVREQEKMNVLANCRLAGEWSRQRLHTVAKLIKWAKFPKDAELAKEGETVDVMAVVKSGECRILRQVVASVTRANKQQMNRRRTVEMCRIGCFESFGEESLLLNQPMSYSVISSQPVELAVIDRTALQGLDDVTLELFKHSAEQCRRKFSQSAVEDEYVKQEKSRRWSRTKSRVLNDALFYSGVKPGSGKWRKSC